MPHLEAHQIMERRARDRAYQAGLMSQDREILRDPDFREFHDKMVKGSALKGTIDFIKSEARMRWLGPNRPEQAKQWREKAGRGWSLDREQTSDALKEIRGTMKRLKAELRAARDWVAGKLPALRHYPPSVSDVVEHWRKRDPTKISEAEALGALPPEKHKAALVEAISGVRGHWKNEVAEIEDVLPVAAELEQKLVNREAALKRAANPQVSRGGGMEMK